MYNPGRNKVKAFFYDHSELEEVQNEVGEYLQKPKLICKDFVELLPLTGRQFLENRKNESEMNYRIRMRYRKDIEVNDVVEFNSIKAEIIYISVFGRYMELVVKWLS